MAISRFDHIAMPAGNPEALIVFYTALGFEPVGIDAWRTGASAAFALAFGDAKINVHPPELWQNPGFTLRAPHAHPGSADMCFAWEGSLLELERLLESAGAPIEEGPVERVGGRALGTGIGVSLYTRDPDGNLLEFIIYDSA